MLVDADIHPTVAGSFGAIIPYMTAGWQRRFEGRRNVEPQGLVLGRGPHFKADGVGGAIRPDTVPPSGGPPGSDPDFIVTHYLDPHNVDIAILLPLQPTKVEMWTDADEANVIVAAYNDLMIDQWLPRDKRFRLAIVVSPHDPAAAAGEIKRLAPLPGVVGVWLPLINTPLGQRQFYPIYEAAQEAELPVILHPNGSEGDYVGSIEFAGGNPGTRAERYVLLGEFAMTNLASLIFNAVFERFPRLKVIFTEFGWSWVGPLLWRLDATWKSGRAAYPWVRRAPTDYVLDHVRFTTEPALEIPESELPQVVEMALGARTLLFSSDYPHWDSEEPRSVFKHLKPEMRERIFVDNAAETFGKRLHLPQVVS